MPINNNLFGVYKSVKLGGREVVASSFSRNRNMQASSINYVQGTPKARVMDIGTVDETISIEAPIFVGAGSTVDGRNIANQKIREILNPQTAVLPILTAANFSIGQDSSSVSLTLESDGDPNNTTAFEISSSSVEALNPLGTPTRLAKFYDIRVQIGSRKYFVMSATINVSATTDKKYFFIPGDWNDYRGWGTLGGATGYDVGTGVGSTNLTIRNADGSARSGSGITFQPGNQFPFIGISGLKISGNGKAAVLLENLTDSGGTGTSSFLDTNESINLSVQSGTTDITLQDPGVVRYENADFRVEIYDPIWHAAQTAGNLTPSAGFGWTSLLSTDIDTSRAIVHTSNFSLTPGLMTVDFNFITWIK